MTTLRERLYSHAVTDEPTGCLLWTGCKNSRGYGVIGDHGKRHLVHRVAWELEHGPIGPGLVIDHVYDRGCRHRLCVNVAHLEPVTTTVNTRRSLAARGHRRYMPQPVSLVRTPAYDFKADLIATVTAWELNRFIRSSREGGTA